MDQRKNVSAKPEACRVRKREIPRSTARAAERRDYAYYFCGAGCGQRWPQEKHNRHVNRSE